MDGSMSEAYRTRRGRGLNPSRARRAAWLVAAVRMIDFMKTVPWCYDAGLPLAALARPAERSVGALPRGPRETRTAPYARQEEEAGRSPSPQVFSPRLLLSHLSSSTPR